MGQASIPVEDIRGELIDLRMLSYEFVILEVNRASCEFALDDIYWEGGITDVEDYELSTNTGFNLQTNYPNPFKNKTAINYSIPKTVDVVITVYDLTGRLVETLVNKTQNAGSYSVDWNSANKLAGVYFYKIKAGNFEEVKKCVLQK